MARRGKVSKGCSTCRKRKIKCDELRPSCAQCLEADWACPQYGDTQDRLFQNQTAENFEVFVTSKSAGGSSMASRGSRRLAGPASASMRISPKVEYNASILPGIGNPIKDRAISFFLSSHVFHESKTPRGYFEYLPSLYGKSTSKQPLSLSLDAVAFAAFANSVRSLSIMEDARMKLVFALRAVNGALQDSKEATKDSTLAAIMLLSTFETITCQTQQSLKDCDTHLKAATTIIKIRGYEQFGSTTGCQIFLQMLSNILLGCLRRGARVPPDVIAHRSHAGKYIDATDPAWRLSDILIEFSEFRANIKDGIISEPSWIIATALSIDAKFSSLSVSMPAGWRFKSYLTHSDSELVYKRYYHIYPDLWTAHIYNNLRTCRMILHQEIRGQLKMDPQAGLNSTPPINEWQSELSRDIISQMALEICASVPQYAGYLDLISSTMISVSTIEADNDYPVGASPRIHHTESIPTAAGTYLLLWQLFKVAELATSPLQRDWVINRLRYIGNATGIQQAFAIADLER